MLYSTRFLFIALVTSIGMPTASGTWIATAHAKRKRHTKSHRAKAVPKPAPAPVAPPLAAPISAAPVKSIETIQASPATAGPAANAPTQQSLDRAKKLYEALEYADVIPFAQAVLDREDATIEQRLDAYLLKGSCLAIVGNPIDAEKPFRYLLRGRPDYDMSAETPPKILSVFRKVQVEEKSIVVQMAELKRSRIIKELHLEGEVPEESKGGLPLTFEYTLRDPGRAVGEMDLHYRRSKGEPFSSLALQIDKTGIWKGEIPGEWTENDDGFNMGYYVTTASHDGVDLLHVGNATSPMSIVMTPGTVADAIPIYRSTWFWVASSGVVAALGVSSYFIYHQTTKLPETDGRIDL